MFPSFYRRESCVAERLGHFPMTSQRVEVEAESRPSEPLNPTGHQHALQTVRRMSGHLPVGQQASCSQLMGQGPDALVWQGQQGSR